MKRCVQELVLPFEIVDGFTCQRKRYCLDHGPFSPACSIVVYRAIAKDQIPINPYGDSRTIAETSSDSFAVPVCGWQAGILTMESKYPPILSSISG